MVTKNGWWMVMLAVGMGVGCNSSGGGSSAPAPNPSEVAQAQLANAGATSVQQTQDAANEALVESGAPGSTQAKAAVLAGGGSAPVSTINFQASVNLTVNLDALNASGQKVYPNASGSFSVSATGTIT